MSDTNPLSWSQVCPGGIFTPLLTAGLPGIGGRLTNAPEDFVVDELLPYEPEDQGDHFFVRVKKQGISSAEVARLLGESVKVASRDVGFAGRKDVHAVATQWFSLPAEPQNIEDERFSILDVRKHPKKLRTGHVKANQFKIRVRDVHPDASDRLGPLLDRLSQGFPNYFGVQRFGRSGRNLVDAERWLSRGCPRIKGPRFLVSVIQSAIYNAWLGHRLGQEGLDQVIAGDLLKKRETGGLFVSDDVAADQPRIQAGEVDLCGPLFGPKMKAASDLAADREMEWVEKLALSDAAQSTLSKFGSGGRRVARVQPNALRFEREADDLVVSFALPSGCYATVLLAELMHPSDGWVDREPV
jgi:tRNA pseudouridine13 synthase